MGIGLARPRISWNVATSNPGWAQTAYEIQLDGVPQGRVASADSHLRAWPGSPLGSRDRRAVAVRVWGAEQAPPTAWSDPVVVEAGLLEPADWTAAMIAPDLPEAELPRPAALLRHGFSLRGPVVAARLYSTAHGVYELELNGSRVGDDVLAPGWTSYGHRLRYRTHDVTALLSDGDNVLGGWLADGWYRGRVGFEGGRRHVYGDEIGLVAQLELRYQDGTVETVATGAGWRSAPSPIASVGLYEGERHDARKNQPGWSAPGFDDTSWQSVHAIPYDPETLVAPTGPPVRGVEIIEPVEVLTSPSGKTILDFGQNIAGRLRITVRGETGRVITLRHAEVLEHGELGVRPLRTATSVDTYILSGDGTEVWEPRFTLHGFRYAQVDGWPGELATGDVVAVVCQTDMERSGWFTSSDPLLDRFHDNVLWSMRGNFVDIPTDCPQRDERMGWTGDIQVFAPTAAYLYSCTGMLESWLADLAAEQEQYGTVPVYVPWIDLGIFPTEPTAAWGDAAVIVPWTLYERTGDVELLSRQYSSMKAWVDQITERAGDAHLWDSGFQLGDWLDPTAPPERPAEARTDPALVASAYLVRCTTILADTAALLDRADDALRYKDLAERAREAFDTEFLSSSGRMASDTQTAYALGLQFDLIEGADRRARAGRRLVELVRAGGHRIATGFVGTPLVCDALTSVGAIDDAYQLLLQTECPSWLYAVTMGGTTVWERWDSILPDGSIHPGEMTSFNHYALGAVADWIHRTVAGLAPGSPGYRHMIIQPLPGGRLTQARAAHLTPYGLAEVSWERAHGELELTVQIPPSTTATVHLPGHPDDPFEITAGTHRFTCPFRDADDDRVITANPAPLG
ncbi:alpha-L-rhamnosidase [Acrocarpospora pleiomorpha]|uniref:alpha-L-rhamnosidase n=1 Tax=Acrocarpospora pleiomorpha TaxID=90975 RepID=A0A5M3X9F8_9ACTN|nr:alpha-L-rhamnosidase [Acrocarpospora pleiomorpha]